MNDHTLLHSLNDSWETVNDAMRRFIEKIANCEGAAAYKGAPNSGEQQQHVVAVEREPPDDRSNRKIQLNVGGTVFVTTEGTLTSLEDTFFSAMLQSEEMCKPDENGHYFIDRSPLVFPFILDYLRSGKNNLDLESIPKHQHDLLRQELDFFQIRAALVDRTKKKIEWLPNIEAEKKGIYRFDPPTQCWSKFGHTATNHATPFFATCLDSISLSDPITWKATVKRDKASREGGWWAGINSGIVMDTKTWITCGINGNIFDCTPKSVDAKPFARWDDEVCERVIHMKYYPTRKKITFMVTTDSAVYIQTFDVHDKVAALPYPCILVNDVIQTNASVTIDLLSA